MPTFAILQARQGEGEAEKKTYRTMMLLGVAYAANIGGTGLVTGSPPNLVLPGPTKSSPVWVHLVQGLKALAFRPRVARTQSYKYFTGKLSDIYGSGHPLTFPYWAAYCIPLMASNLILAWNEFPSQSTFASCFPKRLP